MSDQARGATDVPRPPAWTTHRGDSVVIGACTLRLFLPAVASLKEKRAAKQAKAQAKSRAPMEPADDKH